MVVDLAVHGEDDLAIGAHERLGASVCEIDRKPSPACLRDRLLLTDTNNSKTFVSEDGLLAAVASRPVRTAMADFLGTGKELGPFRAGVVDTVCDDDSAHRVYEGEGC